MKSDLKSELLDFCEKIFQQSRTPTSKHPAISVFKGERKTGETLQRTYIIQIDQVQPGS